MKNNILTSILFESIQNVVPYVFHYHADPRNTNPHYDLRILDPYKKDSLMSYAIPAQEGMDKKFPKKVIAVRTRPHPEHWLTKQTYRIKKLEEGEVKVHVSSPKFFDLEFTGKILRGRYILFKNKRSRRNDMWIIIKK